MEEDKKWQVVTKSNKELGMVRQTELNGVGSQEGSRVPREELLEHTEKAGRTAELVVSIAVVVRQGRLMRRRSKS